MATIARITTRSRAAAMMTAAVGLSPKMVVRSSVLERGSAEPLSSRVSVFTELLTSVEPVRVSVLFSILASAQAQLSVSSYFVDRRRAEGRGWSPAFLYEERTLTYRDVQDLANRTGNALLELGVEMEDRVLLLCLDAPEFLGGFWGAMKIGAVP